MAIIIALCHRRGAGGVPLNLADFRCLGHTGVEGGINQAYLAGGSRKNHRLQGHDLVSKFPDQLHVR